MFGDTEGVLSPETGVYVRVRETDSRKRSAPGKAQSPEGSGSPQGCSGGFERLSRHRVPPSLPQDKLAAHEAVTIVDSVLQELLSGIVTPERAPSPVDAYLTEEDLFRHRNPQVQACDGGTSYILAFR